MPTLAFGRIGNCLMLVHPEIPPSDQDWDKYLEFLDQQRSDKVRLVVSTRGGGPSAAQRGRLRDVVNRYPTKILPTAILTASVVARGVMTAISWFIPGLEAFAPNQLGAALNYLGIPVALEGEVSRAIQGLHKKTSDEAART
jgi:hypothetical protein